MCELPCKNDQKVDLANDMDEKISTYLFFKRLKIFETFYSWNNNRTNCKLSIGCLLQQCFFQDIFEVKTSLCAPHYSRAMN
jgi:hypothetical protein